MPADSQAAKSQPDVNQLGRSFQTFLARESSQQFLARLIVCCLTFGALTFCTAVLAEVEDRIFGAGWLFTALAILVAFLALHKQRSYQRVSVVAAVAFALIASWWVILVLFSRRDPLLSLGQLSLLALLCSTCPWPTRLNLCLCAALLLAPLLIIPMAGFQVTLWLIYAALIAVALWLAAEQRHLFFSKLTHAFLGRYCESGASASRTTLRILASHSAMLADSARALLAYEGGESELVEPSDSVPSQVDPVFVRGLMQKLDDYAGQFGLLARRDWGDQFIAPCHDWFGLVPAHTFFMRFSAVIDEAERKVALFVPLTLPAKLVGIEKVFRSLVSLGVLARISLESARSRFLSSDVLLLSQRSVSEREEDLSKLVHVVNNIAQVIAIESDSLANELESKPIPPDDDARKKMAAQVEQIENLARYLSLEVTDLKLNKELLRIKAFSKGEVVDLNTVAAELRRFADFQSQRRGAQISCSNELGRLAAIEGVNIDLLQTVLRGLLRDAVSTPGDERPQSAVSFKIVGTQVVIEITGNGKVLEWEEFRGQVTEKMIRHRDDPKYMNILGAAHLCELGQGTFEIQPQQGERSVAFKLVFERAMPNSRAAADLSSWALFVDDNPQVTNFYAKVATALDLKYHTAGSLNEAKNLIQSDGKPMLVITDVELGDGNGSELVKDIRERFGPGVPVIVVSGHTEESTRDKINEAGGVKFLSKPVGRAQLFSEIKSLLGKA